MTGTEKFTWGIVLNLIASGLLVVGTLLSFTMIGACIGIPMILVALPLYVWGIVWVFQGQFQKQAESIAAGVEYGLKRAAPTSEQPRQLAGNDTDIDSVVVDVVDGTDVVETQSDEDEVHGEAHDRPPSTWEQ